MLNCVDLRWVHSGTSNVFISRVKGFIPVNKVHPHFDFIFPEKTSGMPASISIEG